MFSVSKIIRQTMYNSCSAVSIHYSEIIKCIVDKNLGELNKKGGSLIGNDDIIREDLKNVFTALLSRLGGHCSEVHIVGLQDNKQLNDYKINSLNVPDLLECIFESPVGKWLKKLKFEYCLFLASHRPWKGRFHNLHIIQVSNCSNRFSLGLTTLGLSLCLSGIQTFYLRGLILKDIQALSNCVALKTLDLSHNLLLTDINPLGTCIALQTLDLS